tara:strand:+ start:346 stop:894 length:549 start_codon:yes stop_codon:yes gene_type:complete
MAAVTYFMLCGALDNLVHDVRTSNSFSSGLLGSDVRSASFSSNPADAPDVPVDKPEPGGHFVSPTTYTPPAETYSLKASWEGNISVIDGMTEMTSNGANKATLRLTKVSSSGIPTESGTEQFRVCIQTSVGKPSVGKFNLVDGGATVDFIPASDEKGIALVALILVNHAVKPPEAIDPISFV